MRPIIEIRILKKNKYHLQTDTPRMMKMPKAAKPKYTKLPECTKQLSIHNLVLLLMEKEIREQDKEKEKEFNLLRVSEHLRLLEVRWDSICCVFLYIWDSLRFAETRFAVCSEHLRLLETRWDSICCVFLNIWDSLRLGRGPQKLMVMMCFEILDVIGRSGVL